MNWWPYVPALAPVVFLIGVWVYFRVAVFCCWCHDWSPSARLYLVSSVEGHEVCLDLCQGCADYLAERAREVPRA